MFSPALLLPVLIAVGASAPASQAKVAGADADALTELTRAGELLILPGHGRSPWRGTVVTQHKKSCDDVERTMMNVRGYPSIWKKMRNVRILSQSPRRVHYAFELDLLLSPKLETVVENPKPGTVVFTGNDTDGRAVWSLEQMQNSCRMVYDLSQPKGSNSGFVKILKRMEPGLVDAAELAGGLALARGYAPPALRYGQSTKLSKDGWVGLYKLAKDNTVVRVLARKKSPPVLVAYRYVSRSVDDVAASIADYKDYGRDVDFLDKVRPTGRGARWSIEYFGGSVDFTTKSTTRQAGRTRIIREKVIGGDLERGYWTWRLTPMRSGTLVELELDLDITEGSTVLRTLTHQDEMIRDSTGLQVALEFMRTRAVKP